MKTREELLTAMSQCKYTTQKDLAEQIGESASNLSKLISKYDLKIDYERNKSTSKAAGHNFNQFFTKCREEGRELWEDFIAQGGEIDLNNYPEGIYVVLNDGALPEAKEAIRFALAAKTPFDDFTEDEQTRIGMLLYRVKLISYSKINRGGTH